MTRYLPLIVLLLASPTLAQDKPKLIGGIEFFGSSGIDLSEVRAVLPFREKDEFSAETFVEKLGQAGEAIKRVTGQRPTDNSPICCDGRGDWIIFIGLSGKTIRFTPPPKGTTRLPENILNLYDRFIKALMEDVQKGASAEDHSKGYSLSAFPPLRSVQLEMRAYAAAHGALLRDVLETSSDDRQRIVAAELLGYARRSESQIAALVRASRDGDSTVRNNATRALIVLAKSSPKVAMGIPAEGFIEMLLSGTWTDLNKASNLLDSMTKSRSARLLAKLRRKEVLSRLIEMARWRSHAEPAMYILGRIAGSDESRLKKLVASDKVEVIINDAQGK